MKTMQSWIGIACLSLVVATAAIAAKPDGWPDTSAGRIGKGWVEAFSAGEPAMRKFLAENLAPESLKKKTLDERMETYRTNREKFGRLAFASVVTSKPSELSVKLLDEDGKQHEFTFVVQNTSPYSLVSITMKQNVRGSHFGGAFRH